MYITIVDLEFLSWKNNYIINNFLHENKRQPWQKKEVIQIGCIKYDEKNFTIIDKLNLYVKPKRNPILNNYIKNLTGLDQHFLNRYGIRFYKAHHKFLEFTKNSKIICNGDDYEVYKENMKDSGIRNYSFKFYNIKKIIKYKFKFNDMQAASPNLIISKRKFKDHNGVDDAEKIFLFLKKKNTLISKILSF